MFEGARAARRAPLAVAFGVMLAATSFVWAAPPAARAATTLSTAFNGLDANGDGQLSTSEISAGIDAFRAAHHRAGAAGGASAQAVSA